MKARGGAWGVVCLVWLWLWLWFGLLASFGLIFFGFSFGLFSVVRFASVLALFFLCLVCSFVSLLHTPRRKQWPLLAVVGWNSPPGVVFKEYVDLMRLGRQRWAIMTQSGSFIRFFCFSGVLFGKSLALLKGFLGGNTMECLFFWLGFLVVLENACYLFQAEGKLSRAMVLNL